MMTPCEYYESAIHIMERDLAEFDRFARATELAAAIISDLETEITHIRTRGYMPDAAAAAATDRIPTLEPL
jgi:hypothetical protein